MTEGIASYKILVSPERGDVNGVDRGVIVVHKKINPSVSLTLDSSPYRGAEGSLNLQYGKLYSERKNPFRMR